MGFLAHVALPPTTAPPSDPCRFIHHSLAVDSAAGPSRKTGHIFNPRPEGAYRHGQAQWQRPKNTSVFFFFWFIPRPAFQDHLLVQSSASCQVASAFESGGTRGHMVASWAVSAAAMIDRGSRIPIWRASSQDAGVVVCVTRWQSPGYHPHLFPWPMMSIGRVDKTAAEAACGCWGNDKKGSAEADPCEEPPHKNAGCFLIAPCGV